MPTVAIPVTHAGSLPRTPELIAANEARPVGEDGFTLGHDAAFDGLLAGEVAALVERQREAGITVPGDGEYGKAMSRAVDYGAWWSYSFQRVGGLSLTGKDHHNQQPVRSEPGRIRLTTFPDRRDWVRFRDAYTDPASGISLGEKATVFPTTTGPLTYRGQELIAADARNLRAALDAAGIRDGFITALSPGSGARIANEYYATEEEHIWAWAEVLRVADRLTTFASLVGAERVQASTDCGLGGRIHPSIAWAKLETLAEGARRASRRLSGDAVVL